MPLETHNLTKRFTGPNGVVSALEDLSLTIAPGQMLAVRGPSGSGKTTLLLMLGGLLRPDSGSVVLDGRDLYKMGAEERAAFRAASIAFVFQQYHLMPYLSVLENVELPRLAIAGSGSHDRARGLIERLGLTDRAGHLPSALSAGERQRVALARALFAQPKLILADEPTGNLDGDNAAIVLNALSEFAASGGMVLLATHDTRSGGHAHATLTLERGKVVGREEHVAAAGIGKGSNP